METVKKEDIREDEMQLVAFKLLSEEYAIDILNVQEIIRWTNYTRVPKAPQFIKGVINLRGTVIPVINSHARFGLPPEEITESTRIIVIRFGDAPIGITVDQVTEVLRIPAHMIENPQEVNGIDNSFIKGIGKTTDRLLIILDLLKVLDVAL